MRILLTNDDGIAAPGLAALYHAVRDMGEIFVVAPADVQSAQSHAVTFHRKIGTRTHRVLREDGAGHLFEGVAVEGKPADCVKLAVAKLVPQPIDLVISGINAGANIGINVIYSGTVAAAMEAGFMGISSIAISLHLGDSARTRWDLASRHTRQVLAKLIAGPFEPHTVLNVNLPIFDNGEEPLGLRVVPASTSPLIDDYSHIDEGNGNNAYRANGGMSFHHTPPDTDVDAVFRRYITVTPLHFELTHKPRLALWDRFVQGGRNPA